MSFILDALRKSESERQRGTAPKLSRAPEAPPRRRTPAWTWIVIASLALALVAISAAWLQNGGLDSVRVPTAMPNPATTAVPAAVPAPTGITRSESEPFTADDRSAGDAGRAASALQTGGAGLADTGAASQDGQELRPAGELARLDPSLPAYTLELLAYNRADPTSGYAWINGRRYFPGERIGAGGPELVEIRADGVVLGYRGVAFLLRQR